MYSAPPKTCLSVIMSDVRLLNDKHVVHLLWIETETRYRYIVQIVSLPKNVNFDRVRMILKAWNDFSKQIHLPFLTCQTRECLRASDEEDVLTTEYVTVAFQSMFGFFRWVKREIPTKITVESPSTVAFGFNVRNCCDNESTVVFGATQTFNNFWPLNHQWFSKKIIVIAHNNIVCLCIYIYILYLLISIILQITVTPSGLIARRVFFLQIMFHLKQLIFYVVSLPSDGGRRNIKEFGMHFVFYTRQLRENIKTKNHSCTNYKLLLNWPTDQFSK